MDIPAFKKHSRPLITLSVAFIQGIMLYGLHTLGNNAERAQAHVVLLAVLYPVVIFVPLTLQLLSEHWRNAYLWRAAAGIGVLYALLGWHFGTRIALPSGSDVVSEEDAFIFALNLALVWIVFLPFLRCRLDHGRWRCEYPQLFAAAWQNVLMLAEAAAFTGAFWLLLQVWQQLFVMLGYRFFHNLFKEPGFVYPVTTVTFGVALYLTGSIERLVTVTREQILGLLKWLAPITALILTLFTPALLFKMPDLIFRDERAIGATWLLWLLALTVLLLNAGYQNGAVEKPYPRFLQLALRAIIPTMVIVAATALYSLIVRILEYGITVGRVYAVVVAVVALGYSVGYAMAAGRRGGPWLKGIERVNVAVALSVFAVLILLLTPIASPYRLAANSQLDRALTLVIKERENKLRHLRWSTGKYGLHALEQIASGKMGKTFAGLDQDAAFLLEAKGRYDRVTTRQSEALIARLTVFPRDRTLEPQLLAQLQKAIRLQASHAILHSPLAMLVDLDGDGVDECVLINHENLEVYAKRGNDWKEIGDLYQDSSREELETLRGALTSGDFAPQTKKLSDLRIGGKVFEFEWNRDADTADDSGH